MHDGFQMVARIPHPATVPKYYTVASEVATMDLLCSSGLPIPEVYGYSPEPDNAAGAEHTFMEFVQGTKLSDVWFDLRERPVTSVVCQLTQLEVDSFPRRRMPVLCTRFGEGGKGTGHPTRGRAFLRRSRCTMASVVWQCRKEASRLFLETYSAPCPHYKATQGNVSVRERCGIGQSIVVGKFMENYMYIDE